MPKVIIDGTEYEVREGRNMLEAVLDNGLDLPYFCWHPAMGSVGSCRLCAVRVYKDESDARGKIAMACMTPAIEGTRIAMNDPEAMEFRRYVIEWLMTNHPHDCPICDEGGECHLQDMTTMCGQVHRRYRFNKRTCANQYLGPFVTHEMNRCIQCYRCVRFYRDLAGGRDFDSFGSRNRMYFGRQQDGVLESEFSGNLVEVCPTGVFTDKTSAKHYTRKWDLESAPSVCIHCGLGCNTIPGARYGALRRVVARFNGDVNGYFLCDRGRFGYEFASLRGGPSDLSRVRTIIAEAKGVVGVGSPRASLESNYALRTLVRAEHYSTGLSAFEQDGVEAALEVLRRGPARTPSLAEVEQSDVVLVLGVDPTNEAPMLDFAIRQAMRKAPLGIARKLKIPDWDARAVANALQDAKGKLYIAAPWSIKIGEIAAASVCVAPPGVAGFADGILGAMGGESDGLSAGIAADLTEARQPLIVTGISAGRQVLAAAAGIAAALCEKGKDCGLFITVPEANTMGGAMLSGFSVVEAARRIESGEADTLVVLENDLSRRMSRHAFSSLIEKTKNLIVLDCVSTDTTAVADAVISVPSVFESDGIFVSSEGRAQRFFAVQPTHDDAKQAWAVLQELAESSERDLRSCPEGREDLLRELAAEKPEFAAALEAAPFAEWRSQAGQKVARESNRFSGRTAKDVGWTIHEPQPPDDAQTPLSFSMEGDQNPPPAPLVLRCWWPGWNSNEAINKFQIEVGGALHGGNPGKRLIEVESRERRAEGRAWGADEAPSAPSIAPDATEVWLIPRPSIFGSEELSSRAPAIRELVPRAEAALHSSLAAKLMLTDGQTARIDTEDQALYLPVRVDDSVAPGVISVPLGLDETRGIVAPTIARVR